MIVVAALLLFAPMTPPAAAKGGVWWEVDHANKLVVVHARVTFWREGPPPTPELVNAMIDGFRRGWEGEQILCYRLHVRVHADVAADAASVPPDSIGLRLVGQPYLPKLGGPGEHHHVYPYTRSYIAANAATLQATHFGDDPSNRGVAELGPIYLDHPEWQSRVWVADPRPMTLPHEFGHIIGLEHNYGMQGELLPHAVPDAMFNNGVTGAGKFFPETITKAVRRGGVDLSTLACSRHLEAPPFDMNLHAPRGYIGLEQIRIEADNCAWIPPSSDPAHQADMNVWQGKLVYSPRMNTPGEVDGWTVHPVFASQGTVKKPVEFETVSWRGEDRGPERWWTWETVKLYDDADLTATADLQLRSMGKPPAAENLGVHAHFGDSKAGQWGFKSKLPIFVTIRDQACP